VQGRAPTTVAPDDPLIEVERWSLRAQALAELRALSRPNQEPETPAAGSHLYRTIVLP
jgi:hypothetical protein